jgi:hypothetical protein
MAGGAGLFNLGAYARISIYWHIHAFVKNAYTSDGPPVGIRARQHIQADEEFGKRKFCQ